MYSLLYYLFVFTSAKSIENTDTLNKVQSTSVQDSVSKSESAKPETTPMGQVNKHQPSLQSNRHGMVGENGSKVMMFIRFICF